MTQRFGAAVETYEKLQAMRPLTEQEERRRELCREYADIKPDDDALLGDTDLARFILTHFDTVSGQFAQLIFYHDYQTARKRNPETYAEVVLAMLVRHNALRMEDQSRLKLAKRPQGWHLDLSNTPFSSYLVEMTAPGGAVNILQPLQLHSLDISHTPVSLAKELRVLELKELRMVGVRLQPNKGIMGTFRNMGLERVVFGEGEYPERLIRNLRNIGIEVVEEEHEPQNTKQGMSNAEGSVNLRNS
jgi:hypothetical protein